MDCPSCGVVRDANDVFCENCGYDFATGSLPADAGAVAAAAPVVAVVSASRDWFERQDAGGTLDFPDPEPATARIAVTGTKVLIGRQSRSRGVYPEIDVGVATGDPAVSARHAMLLRRADGRWSVADLGSTNGTYLGPDDRPVPPGDGVALALGDVISVGAWTTVVLSQPEQGDPP